VRYAALLVGLLVVAQGVLGLLLPDLFFRLVRAIQAPPILYLAAVVRILFGVILVLASKRSRAPMFLRGLGLLILIGGILTPFFGAQFAEIVLGWWSEDPSVVRTWAGFALLLGTLIVYANTPKRP
jgi:hypothetical protein